jgi:Peptidase family C25/CARDB
MKYSLLVYISLVILGIGSSDLLYGQVTVGSSTRLNSSNFSILSRNDDTMTIEFRLPDPDKYVQGIDTGNPMAMIDIPRESILLAVPQGSPPHAEVLEISIQLMGAGREGLEHMSGKQAAKDPRFGNIVNRIISERELGFLRDVRLALYQVRPIQRLYRSGQHKHYLIPRVKFLLHLKRGSKASSTISRNPMRLLEVAKSMVFNPDDLAFMNTKAPAGKHQPIKLPPRYLKVETAGEGIFEISGETLLSLDAEGLVEKLAVRKGEASVSFVLLSSDGNGKTTGRIETNDRLLFYLAGSTSSYSRQECVRISFSGGGRIAQDIATRDAGAASNSILQRSVFEKDTIFESETEMGNNQEHFWFWASTMSGSAGPPMEAEIVLPGVAGGTLEVTAELFSSAAQELVRNTTAINVEWKGLTAIGKPEYRMERGRYPRLLLTQTLRADGVGNATALLRLSLGKLRFVQSIMLDRITVNYQRTLDKTSSQAVLTGPEKETWLQWTPLSDEGLLFAAGKGALYTAKTAKKQLQYNIPADCRIIYLPGKGKQPDSIRLRNAPRFAVEGKNLDVLVVSHRDFIDTLQPWLEFRRSQYIRLEVVDVEDLYDAFGDGTLSPESLKRGVEYLYRKTGISGLILCGDASWDYWGRFANPVPNWVPAYHLSPEYPSDSYYANICGRDAIPDLMISRMPVQSTTDLANALEKIMNYPGPDASGAWAGRFLLMADNTFEEEVERVLHGSLPLHLRARSLHYTDFSLTDNFYYPEEVLRDPEFRIEGGKTSPDCTKRTIAEIDRGNLAVLYLGHGGGNVFGHERYFFGGQSDYSDVLQLQETKHPPFFEIYSCWTGWFDFARPKWNIGLGEDLLRKKNKGAVGLFLSTGKGLPYHHEVLAGHLHHYLYEKRTPYVGAAVLAAQTLTLAEVESKEPARMFTLFGDCLLQLAVPPAELEVSLEPKAAEAGSKRILKIEAWGEAKLGRIAELKTLEVMVTDAAGQPVFDATLMASYDSKNKQWSANLPAFPTADAGELRVAVYVDGKMGGTRGNVTVPPEPPRGPVIKDGTPDLAIESARMITLDPMEGETVIFEVTVENRGTASASNFYLEAYDGVVGNSKKRLDDQVMLPPNVITRLDPGEKMIKRIRWDPWFNAGRRNIYFVADPNFRLPDTDLMNNVLLVQVNIRGKSDLRIGGQVLPSSREGHINCEFKVTNSGMSVAGNELGEITMILKVYGDDSEVLHSRELDAIAPLEVGGEKTLEVIEIPDAYQTDRGMMKVRSIEVIVDPIDIVNESTHKNNTCMLRVSATGR